MPLIVLDTLQIVLRCINHQLGSHKGPLGIEIETMKAEASWVTLVGVDPKQAPAPGVPLAWTQHPRLNLSRGQAVRTYTCSVCGYVEMYDATVIDPGNWGGP
jgi:hypothetical protein